MQVAIASAVSMINFYQRRISPYKKYRCAHCVFHHQLSCSEYVKQTIRVHGCLKAIPLISQRFKDCRAAHVALQALESKFEKLYPVTKDSKPYTKQGDVCVNVCTMPCL